MADLWVRANGKSKGDSARTITTKTTLHGKFSKVRTEVIYPTHTFNSISGPISTTVTSILRSTGNSQPQSSSSSSPTASSTSSHTSSANTSQRSSSAQQASRTGTAAAASGSAASGTVSQQHNNGGKGFTGGDIAGAAIGCLVGGALIAFLVAFLIFRKKNKSNNYNNDAAAAETYYNRPPSAHTQSTAVAGTGTLNEKKSLSDGSSNATGWMAYLPQSADDRTIQNAVKTFFNAIELHVDNFYHRSLAPLDDRTKEALAQLDSGKLPGRLEDMLPHSGLAIPAIKHSIADLLITRMSPLTFPETSLLPAHLAATPPKLQSSSGESSAAQQAYSQWRLLNAYLYPSPEKDVTYTEDREMKATEIGDLLNAAFAPWQNVATSASRPATPANEEDEKLSPLTEHERGLVATAGNLGILLISQPAAFEFRWSEGGVASRSVSGRPMIAFPGFWKTADEAGRPVEGGAQKLVDPVVLRV